MIKNKSFPTEPSREELLEVYRAYRLLLSKEDNRTPEEKWWDELCEYNPFLSRYELRGEIKEDVDTESPQYKELLASLFGS